MSVIEFVVAMPFILGSILSLLLSIAKFKACVFEKSHLKALLAAYNASLSTTGK